ncbi:MAG: hypothetical protein AVDCRST_MAG39-1675, partial [uncultured Sphingomonadaceae bacterium]
WSRGEPTQSASTEAGSATSGAKKAWQPRPRCSSSRWRGA